MKIATQGIEASFHSMAVRRIFKSDAEILFCTTFKEVFEKLNSHAADRAVVAIENSLYGTIHDVHELLLTHPFTICGEIYEEIGLHLLGVKDSTIADIKHVYSQAPALGEASVFLEEKLQTVEKHEYADTALAARDVAQWGDKSKAAIASRAAAELYGLSVLHENIETHHENFTRFIALSREDIPQASANKTSVVFQTPDIPGALHKALGVFADAGVNLSKLESRPIIGKAWRYRYFVDFNYEPGTNTVEIIEQLKNHATDIRVLGNYPRGAYLAA
mgnify:FL=1